MSHQTNSPDPDLPEIKTNDGRKPWSTWLVVGLALSFLGLLAVGGLMGISLWLLFAGLLLVLTAAYALFFRRQSWARLLDKKKRRQALAVGGGLVILGFVAAGMAAPGLDQVQQATEQETSSPEPTTSVTPTPAEASIANQDCSKEAETRTQQDVEYICTLNENDKLLWMDKDSSVKVTDARKAAQEQAKAEAEAQAEAERRAAAEAEAARKAQEQAEAQRQAEDAEAEARRQAEEAEAEAQRQAEAEAQRQAEAEAQRQAEEAEAEAQRLAEEQARRQPPPGNFTYANCDAVRAAGADPITVDDPGWQPRLDGNDNDGIGCE